MNAETNGNNVEKLNPSTQKNNSRMKWWQWILVYPTLIISILGSMPTIGEWYRSMKLGISFGQSSIAEIQNEMWRKNLECAQAPYKWYKNAANVQVDGTICKSGDVLVRIETPQKRTNFWWVPVDGLIKISQNNKLINSAFASALATPTYWAKANTQVLCQRFVSDGKLLRRIKSGQSCFDEIVNTYTGQVLSRSPAPCNPGC